jgi:hypothetical protein
VTILGRNFTAYIDHSVIEIFDGDKHTVRRGYDTLGLPSLGEFLTFPIQQLQLCKVDSIW